MQIEDEIDYLIGLNEQGVIVHSAENAAFNLIKEWFDTERGEVFGNPSFGNDLSQFKHEPLNSDSVVTYESAIVFGLSRDLPMIKVSGIRVELISEDQVQIWLYTPHGTYGQIL